MERKKYAVCKLSYYIYLLVLFLFMLPMCFVFVLVSIESGEWIIYAFTPVWCYYTAKAFKCLVIIKPKGIEVSEDGVSILNSDQTTLQHLRWEQIDLIKLTLMGNVAFLSAKNEVVGVVQATLLSGCEDLRAKLLDIKMHNVSSKKVSISDVPVLKLNRSKYHYVSKAFLILFGLLIFLWILRDLPSRFLFLIFPMSSLIALYSTLKNPLSLTLDATGITVHYIMSASQFINSVDIHKIEFMETKGRYASQWVTVNGKLSLKEFELPADEIFMCLKGRFPNAK